MSVPVIRGQPTAAPLKQVVVGERRRTLRVIRGQLTAAPLKPPPQPRPVGQRRCHPRSADRGPIEALPSARRPSSASHPRSADRGPIEASDVSCTQVEFIDVIRGQLTAAPLKQDALKPLTRWHVPSSAVS